jgi:hypothetical protein
VRSQDTSHFKPPITADDHPHKESEEGVFSIWNY